MPSNRLLHTQRLKGIHVKKEKFSLSFGFLGYHSTRDVFWRLTSFLSSSVPSETARSFRIIMRSRVLCLFLNLASSFSCHPLLSFLPLPSAPPGPSGDHQSALRPSQQSVASCLQSNFGTEAISESGKKRTGVLFSTEKLKIINSACYI